MLVAGLYLRDAEARIHCEVALLHIQTVVYTFRGHDNLSGIATLSSTATDSFAMLMVCGWESWKSSLLPEARPRGSAYCLCIHFSKLFI